MAEPWLKWMSMAPCLMWEPLSANWVIFSPPVGAVTVPLLPDVVWPGESSGISCLSWPPDTSHPGYMARCTRPALARLYLMVAKCGDQRNTNCGSSAAMTVPWLVGSVASKTETKHAQLHYYWNLASRALHRSFAVGNSDGMAMYNRPRPVSNLSQTLHFPAQERKKERPRKTWSECVKTDVDKCGLANVDPLGRDAWRASIWHSLVLPSPLIGTLFVCLCVRPSVTFLRGHIS